MPYFRATDCFVFDTIIVTLQSVCRKVVATGVINRVKLRLFALKHHLSRDKIYGE